MEQVLTLGLDMGTTTVSCVVADASTGTVLESRTCKTNGDIPSRDPAEKCQDVEKIRTLALELLDQLLDRHPRVKTIGLTGQMHGILYLDGEGKPVSPLYTWQDTRSASLCPRLQALTGYRIAPGYGLATHCALAERGLVPASARKLCTVMDYLAFVLTGGKKLVMHASNAASLGFFDLKEGCFDPAALEKAGIDPELLPEVTRHSCVLGTYRGISVAVAIGDNQASFLGAVPRPEDTALVNFGTGSQISRMVPAIPAQPLGEDLELRPYLGETYLLCGSALCGGRAYALLEAFFRRFLAYCGSPEIGGYDVLNRLAAEGLAGEPLPVIRTTFCGTRSDPGKLGSMEGLSENSFTPEAFAAGVLLGMARELEEMFRQMPGGGIRRLAASGNGVRKNPALLQAVQRVFAMEAEVPECPEEAAFGAALFASRLEEKEAACN